MSTLSLKEMSDSQLVEFVLCSRHKDNMDPLLLEIAGRLGKAGKQRMDDYLEGFSCPCNQPDPSLAK